MYVEGHHPLEQLQDLAQAIPQKRIWRRFPALILAMQGRTAQDIARGWACSRRAGKNGGVPDNRGGVTALQERPHPGRPPRRAPDHDSGGKQRRDDPPRPEDGVCTWRGRDGPRVLEQEFGVRWGLPAVSDLLHRRDYRRRMPRPQHEPANPAVPEFFPESVVAPSDALAAAHPDTAGRSRANCSRNRLTTAAFNSGLSNADASPGLTATATRTNRKVDRVGRPARGRDPFGVQTRGIVPCGPNRASSSNARRTAGSGSAAARASLGATTLSGKNSGTAGLAGSCCGRGIRRR